jgi:hypothetical protein
MKYQGFVPALDLACCAFNGVIQQSAVIKQQDPAMSEDGSTDGLTLASLSDILPMCSGQFGLQGLACLAACSRHLQQACLATVRNDACNWLTSACVVFDYKNPSNKGRNYYEAQQAKEQGRKAVVWMLQAALAVAAADSAAQQLIDITYAPLEWVLQLTAAGVRITYTQLLAAAHSMVAGVEVWVQAQQQLEIETDTPAAAKQICCCSMSVSSNIVCAFM